MRASRIEGIAGGMGLGSNRAASSARGSSKPAVKKALKAAKKAKPLAEPKSAVKVLPRKTAPKSGLEGRGAKLTPKEKAQRASDLSFGKMEKRFDTLTEMRSTGLVSSRKGLVAARGAGKNNQRKADAIEREANKVNIYEKIKKPAIKIDTNPLKTTGFSNLKRKVASMNTPVNRAKAKVTARALKAANKKKK